MRCALRITLLACVLVSMLVAQPVSASHWSLYYAGFDESAGVTMEPDGAVVHAPGNAVDGVSNRISHGVPGQGSLFLDARLGNHVGIPSHPIPLAVTFGFDVYAGDRGSTSGLLPTVLPGSHHVSAWYGWWTDLAGDGVIRDIHDGACGAARCMGDEFVWRGLGSEDHDVAIVLYRIPGNQHAGNEAYSSGLGHADRFNMVLLKDRTALENAEQSWSGAFQTSTDSALLHRFTTVVVAGAPVALGTSLGYAIHEPEALVDVDHYEAVSDEVQSLYLATLGLRRLDGNPVPMVVDLYNAVAPTVLGAVAEARAVWESNAAAVGAPDRAAGELLSPPYAREPNHIDDDFEDRAIFGAVGSPGDGNTYPGYTDAWGFYFDNVARVGLCAGARPGAGSYLPQGPEVTQCSSSAYWTSASVSGSTYRIPWISVSDPAGAQRGERTGGMLLTFAAYVLVWRDVNGDGHLGTVCDASDPEEFDAEHNRCREAPHPWPHRPNSSEARSICDASNARGITFTLTPLGGSWGSAVVIRDIAAFATDATAVTQSFEVHAGTEPITLRWHDVCRVPMDDPNLHGRDAVYFPGGAQVPIRVEAAVSVSAFEDTTISLRIENQHVVDVDVLQPLL